MPPSAPSPYILAKVRRSPTADLHPLPLNELARAALGSISHIVALQTLQFTHGELLVHFRWSGAGEVLIPADVLNRYGLAIELDSILVPAPPPASNLEPRA